jgi:outer membrane protein TolC
MMHSLFIVVSIVSLAACVAAGQAVDNRGEETPAANVDRSARPMSVQSQGEVQPDEVPVVAEPRPAQPVGKIATALPADPQRVLWHVLDPSNARKYAEDQLGQVTKRADQRYYERLLARIDSIALPDKAVLTLEDALRRAMVNSLAVRVASYNPAIDTTRVVEAEAAFDATFFANLTKNKQNRPSASTLVGTDVDSFDMTGGVRKRLPTGMQVATTLNIRRVFNTFAFQQLNPAYDSAFAVELRQPFLQGFGIDFNRSFIRLARLDRRISEHAFRRQVITTLVDVERAFWDLVIARREVVLSGRLLCDFEQIYDYLYQRRDFDAYQIQIAETKARLEREKARFIQILANVRNAEDRLINLLNDPTLDLSDNVEIIPLDFPSQAPVLLDRLSEVQAALDHRPELREAKLGVKRARIAVGQAKNQALPRLDTVFRYTVDGLGSSAHRAFSEVTKNDFHEYFIGVEFEWPIGNRGPRAAHHRASLQHAQAIAALERVFEDVIFDVNLRVRAVQTSYDQIQPEFESVEANDDQVEAIRARAESKNFVQLSQELNALQTLAARRRSLLSSLVEYTMAIIELERAKGTLPEYNNIVLTADDE